MQMRVIEYRYVKTQKTSNSITVMKQRFNKDFDEIKKKKMLFMLIKIKFIFIIHLQLIKWENTITKNQMHTCKQSRKKLHFAITNTLKKTVTAQNGRKHSSARI